jgi:hypothetical protein
MNEYVLNSVNFFNNYGLMLFGNTFDPAFNSGFFYSKPNISIIGASCFIDYSNTTDISDLTYLKKLFLNLPNGITFNVSNANYYDEEKNVTKNLTGTFSVNKLLDNDKLIIGNIISGFSTDVNYSYFDKNNFTTVPQFTTTYTGGATAQNYVLNNLTKTPSKSFINAGTIGSIFGEEEYVELIGSTYNLGKLKINSSMKLKDNKEILYLDSPVLDENLSNIDTKCIFLLRGNADPVILNTSKKNIGCYVIFDSSGNQKNCFENQNRLQAFLRAQKETKKNSGYWVPCLDCGSLTDNSTNALNPDLSLLFDASAFVYIVQQPLGFLTTSNNYGFSYNYLLYSNISGNNSLQSVSEMTFDIEYGFKLDVSHPTLKNFEINIFLDKDHSIPITENIYQIGFPGYNQSSIIYQKTSNSPKVLYLSFSGPTVINLKISVL